MKVAAGNPIQGEMPNLIASNATVKAPTPKNVAWPKEISPV